MATTFLLADLRIEFASNFEYYLQAVNGLSINSSGKMIKNLKKVIRDCVDRDWLDRDLFWRYKVNHIDPKIPHLSADELKGIERKRNYDRASCFGTRYVSFQLLHWICICGCCKPDYSSSQNRNRWEKMVDQTQAKNRYF